MKKVLLIMLALMVSFLTTVAQKVTNESNRIAKTSIEKQAIEVKTETIRFQGVQQNSDEKASDVNLKENTGNLPRTPVNVVNKAVASSPLEGTYTCAGTDRSKGAIQWEATITQDTSDPNKFWIKNIVNYSVGLAVYGTLNGTTLTIPAGQALLPNSSTSGNGHDDAALVYISGGASPTYSATNPITAKVSLGSGIITFDCGLGVAGRIGGTVQSTFYTIILSDPKPVFTNKAGGTGADDPVPPSVYLPTPGTLYYGLSSDIYKLTNFYAVAPPYQTWNFKNITVEVPKLTYSWLYNGETDDNGDLIAGSSKTSTEKNLSYNVETGSWLMPKLTSIMPTEQSEFTLGLANNASSGALTYTDSYIDAGGGGQVAVSGHLWDLTNANANYGYVKWQFSANDYMFGTGSTCACNKLISFFDGNPNGMVYFEGVNVFMTLTAPPTAKFKLEVVKATKNASGSPVLGDVIATSEATIENYLLKSTSVGTLQFSSFAAQDEDGFYTELPYVEVEGSYALVLSGFDVDGVSMAVVSERDDRPDGGINNSFFGRSNGSIYSWTGGHNTMFFSLVEGYYSYLQSSDSIIQVPREGGKFTIELKPFFNKVWINGDLPAWITSSQNDHFTSDNWGSTVTLTVAPSETNRSSVIQYATYGARANVKINQSDGTGIPATKAQAVSAVRDGDNFVLKYPASTASVSIYNVAGQKIASYPLPAAGTFTVPAENYPKGVYLFNFTGAAGATTLKVIK